MAKSGESRAESNRRIRQEALREQLANKGLVQQVIEASEKLADLDQEMDSIQVQRLKAANDSRLALIKKYLPDLKQSELVGEGGGPIQVQEVRRTIVDPEHSDS